MSMENLGENIQEIQFNNNNNNTLTHEYNDAYIDERTISSQQGFEKYNNLYNISEQDIILQRYNFHTKRMLIQDNLSDLTFLIKREDKWMDENPGKVANPLFFRQYDFKKDEMFEFNEKKKINQSKEKQGIMHLILNPLNTIQSKQDEYNNNKNNDDDDNKSNNEQKLEKNNEQNIEIQQINNNNITNKNIQNSNINSNTDRFSLTNRFGDTTRQIINISNDNKNTYNQQQEQKPKNKFQKFFQIVKLEYLVFFLLTIFGITLGFFFWFFFLPILLCNLRIYQLHKPLVYSILIGILIKSVYMIIQYNQINEIHFFI